MLGLFDVLELARPFRVITSRKFHPFGDALGRIAHVAVDVACRKIDKNKTHELTVLVANARRSGAIIDIRDERNGNLRAGWRRN